MLRAVPLVGLLLVGPTATVHAQFLAERVTVGSAGALLFGGSDADGGIDDWYLSNGVVEVIIDDVGVQLDLPVGVTPPPKQSEAAFTGGSLLDLGLVGADNDQLGQLFTVGGLSTENFIVYDSISGSVGPSEATVRVTGSLLGFAPVLPSELETVTEYTVAGSDPFLTITTTVTNTSAVPAVTLGGFLDAILWTQRAIVPFSPLPGRGFDHRVLDFSDPAALAAALELPAFAAGPGNLGPQHGIMDPTTGRPAGEVAYGLLGVDVSLDPDGPGGLDPTVTPVNTLFGVSSNLVTALGNLPATGALAPGASLTYRRRIYVGDRNDVASVANPMILELARRQGFATGTLSGNVDAVDESDLVASVIATRTGGPDVPGFATGAPVTHFRTDATGAFSGVVLPVGTYDLEVRSVERDPVIVAGVSVVADTDTLVPVPALSGLATLELRVFERVSGPDPLVPAKVTVLGIDGTPNPVFNKDFEARMLPLSGPPLDIFPETFPGGAAQRNFIYLADGTATVRLRPGRYELRASRGLEYSVKRRKVRLREGRTRRRKLKLRRLVDTSGYISADFHIHSARSFDSSAGLRDRVASFAGEGVEVMVSTDHDYHTDYGPIIADLGLGLAIRSIVGNEVTTSVPNPPTFPNAVGHLNAWPVQVLPDARRDGSIEDEFVAPNFLYSRLRGQGAEVVQYNHPRAGVAGLTVIGLFNNIGYDPNLPLDSSANDVLLADDVTGASGVANPQGFRNIDFDVMEIINGTGVTDYLTMRRDWLSLLNQTNAPVGAGRVPFIGGTAVSDSHRITLESAGYGRTYVGGAGDDPATLDLATFDANILAGNMMGTTGPYIEFSIEGAGGVRAGIGGTLAPAGPDVTLRIRVQASNWIPVDEVRIVSNGFVIRSFDATTTPAVRPGPRRATSQLRSKVVRFEANIPISLATDSYFMVEAGARLDPVPTPPAFVDDLVPGNIPIAFTNPIFVDLAGDGFDPPGLPVLRAAAGGRTAAVAGPGLSGLSPEKRAQVLEHQPIHRLRLPLEAVRSLLSLDPEQSAGFAAAGAVR